MVDTHSHLDNSQFDADRAETLERAFSNGVKTIIIPSIEPGNFDAVRALADSDPRLYRGIGIHPHNAHQATEEDFARIEQESGDQKVVAIGEIGLDYYYDFAPRDAQLAVFRKQLQIAKRCDKPVIIHNRESDDDLIRIIDEEQDGTLKGVLHCFSGNVAMLCEVIRLGLHVSYTGNITYKKSTLVETVAATPLDRVMIETDAPYMTPAPHRGKRNEPAYLIHIAQKIAEIHSETLETIISMTTSTAKKLFRLLIMLALITLSTAPILAQVYDNPRDEQENEYEEDVPNPYQKFIGVGATLATNTIIDLQECNDGSRRSVSYDGVLSFGGAVNYGLFNFMDIDASYIYTNNKNKEVVRWYPDGNYHHYLTLNARFVANARKRIGFIAIAGAMLQFNNIMGNKNVKYGIDVGIGFEGHIPTSFGMIVPTAEWRVAIPFSNDNVSGNPTFCDSKSGTLSTIYSIPRFTLYWYPKF